MMPSRLTRPDLRPGGYRSDQTLSRPASDNSCDQVPKRLRLAFGVAMVTLVAVLGVVASVPSLRDILGPSRPYAVTTTVTSYGPFPANAATMPPAIYGPLQGEDAGCAQIRISDWSAAIHNGRVQGWSEQPDIPGCYVQPFSADATTAPPYAYGPLPAPDAGCAQIRISDWSAAIHNEQLQGWSEQPDLPGCYLQP